MPKTTQILAEPQLAAVIDSLLPRLKILSLDLDTYASEYDAATLRGVIEELEAARPMSHANGGAADFVVNAAFRVRRSEVADLLRRVFDGVGGHWYTIVEFVEPPAFHFRVSNSSVVRYLDYPLNEGGSLGVCNAELGSEVFYLNLESISYGLNAMATECPTHFADFLNGRADLITGDAFFQCCQFGEVIS